jgi:tRNA threonylcarbamoyladenosine biosynthesis protein TsaB
MAKIIGFHQPIFAFHGQEMSTKQNIPILLINTALSEASVGISVDGILVDELINNAQKEHAAFLHPAIEHICNRNNITLADFKAVSVINGPGSYTGLRVGLAAAKGICFALQLPLICINTLYWIAYGNKENPAELIAPMIDARRMEVFTAVYNKNMESLVPPNNMVLEENSFGNLLETNSILFVGDGSSKWEAICKDKNARFTQPLQNNSSHGILAFEHYSEGLFADLFDAAPFYTKDFYTAQNG